MPSTVTTREGATSSPVDPGVESNARLTAATGAMLLVLLAAEGLTLVSLDRFLRWHELIGVLVLPPIVLKLGATGYRFVRYYTGDEAYGRKGPPHWVLRLTAPGMVFVTVTLLASGLLLALVRDLSPWVLVVHKASFILWFGAMTIHVLGHVQETAKSGIADLQNFRDGALGKVVRWGAVLTSVASGAVLAALLASRFVR